MTPYASISPDFETDGTIHNGDVDGSLWVDVDDVVMTILLWGSCEDRGELPME